MILSLAVLDALFIVIATMDRARVAATVLTIGLMCTAVLYAASVRAAHNDQADRLQRYMNITIGIFAISLFLFLSGK